MSPRPYALKAMGMINALGQAKAALLTQLLAPTPRPLPEQAGWLPGREAMVGAVEGELPPLPAAFDSRCSRLLACAYQQIEADVQRSIGRFGAGRVGVVVGSSTSGIAEGEQAWSHYRKAGHFPEDFLYSQQELGSASAVIAALSGARGPTLTVSTACTSSARAFASARNLLDLGVCDAVIVGGGDSLCKLTLQGFGSLSALSRGRSNPMSRHRDGINIGEGAALFLLTHCERAEEICLWGIGESSDAHHISAPDPSGEGAFRAMEGALEDAGIGPQDIGYINLHGTGTKLNDAMESKAVHQLFGPEVPCSSTKPLVGHTLGAAGATEVGFCWLLYQAQLMQAGRPAMAGAALPPHHWDGAVDEALSPLALVQPDIADKGSHQAGQDPSPQASGTRWREEAPFCMSNSFAFGGNNCAIVIGPGRTA